MGSSLPSQKALSAGRPADPGQSFVASVGFVLSVMLAAGLAEYLWRFHLKATGALEQGWFRGLLGAWGVVLLAGTGVYWRWLYRMFSSVRTSVTILTLFALTCVAGSFVLQQRDLDTRGLTGEKAYQAFRLAQAGFLHHMFHGRGGAQPQRENAKQFFGTLRERFGNEFADERVALFDKMMGGRYQDSKIELLAENHDEAFRRFWEFCQVTQLSNVHRSWWFLALMTMLGISLACGTWKRFVWRKDQVGFHLTHLGFLVLMIGFTLSLAGEQRGMLPLNVGTTLDRIWEFGSQQELKLPFRVTLEDFYTEFHQEIFLEFQDVDHKALQFPGPIQRGVKAEPGRKYPMWGGKYRLEILDASEYGSSDSRVVNRDQGPLNPAISIDVTSAEGLGANGWLFAGSGAQSFYQDPEGKFVLSFHWEDPRVEVAPEPGVWGSVELAAEGFAPVRIDVREGHRFEFAGLAFEIRKVAPDFSRRNEPAETSGARNPAVLFAITAPGETEPKLRWNFAWIDFDRMHTPAHPEVSIQYTFRSGKLDPTRVLRIHGRPDGGLELIRFDSGGKPARSALDLRQELQLGFDDLSLQVGELFPRAALEHPVTPVFEKALVAADRLAGPAPRAPATRAGSGSSSGKGSDHPPHPGHDEHEGHDHPPGQAHAIDSSGTGEPDEHAGHDHPPGAHGEDPHAHAGEDGHDHSGHGHGGPGAKRKGAFDQLLGPLAPELERKFQPPGPPAVKLRLTHPGGVVERWFLSGHPEAGRWTDGTLSLVFGPNENKVKEWRSLLVVSDGVTTRRQMVRVNHPMEVQGWTLYQTDAKLEDPTYSGIQVLADPGWYLIEPGLVMVCFGVIFMFWIKPWLKMDPVAAAKGGAP